MKSEPMWLADQGDGTYRNPVLFCDYSDPDAIRVGDTYYLTASSFNYVPGLPILTSKDLVNWTLANYALPNIPEARYATPRHAQGVWAPSIRHHEGRFYIYYGMPDEGIYMISAEDALGKWDDPVCVLPGKGLIDPCPFWDDDGRAWVIHGYAKSRIGFKSFLGIFPMSWDGRRATGEDHLLFDGRAAHPTMEGPKVHKVGEDYFIFAPAGGVVTGWQVALRSKCITGPYTDRVVLKQGGTSVNGPHQGAWVDTPEGEHWFLHFQSRGLYGRVVHMQPMTWGDDGWPRIGVEDEHPVPPESIACGEDAAHASVAANSADCGVPTLHHKKPKAPACPRTFEQTSDDFTGPLGMQWQFMGNWRSDFYDVGGGKLTLHARAIPEPDGTLWPCPQVITQKVAGPAFAAETAVDVRALGAGCRAGFVLLGGQYGGVAIERGEDGDVLRFIVSDGSGKGERVTQEIALGKGAGKIGLRVALTPVAQNAATAQFYWKKDGGAFEPVGEPFSPARHMWVGARLALFAVPGVENKDGGSAAFDAFAVRPLEG